MVSSMTGFSRRIANTKFGEVRWEVRSLNHRGLEINIHLPDMLRQLERDCRQLISAKIKRGRIDAFLRISGLEGAVTVQQLDMKTVAALLSISEVLRESIPRLGGLSVPDVLKWPGVFAPLDLEQNDLPKTVLTEFSTALKDLVADRNREGKAIEKILGQKARRLQLHVKDASEMIEQIQTITTENLKSKIEDLEAHVDPARFEQEIALYLVKCDVSEEIERFALHVAEFQRVLTDEAEAGKRLGFLAQEIGREVNTLSSKSGYFPLTALMVDAKVVVEQIREQVQNIA